MSLHHVMHHGLAHKWVKFFYAWIIVYVLIISQSMCDIFYSYLGYCYVCTVCTIRFDFCKMFLFSHLLRLTCQRMFSLIFQNIMACVDFVFLSREIEVWWLTGSVITDMAIFITFPTLETVIPVECAVVLSKLDIAIAFELHPLFGNMYVPAQPVSLVLSMRDDGFMVSKI